MDKNQFLSLLNRYSGSSVEEAEKLLLLKSQYPYSQLLHTLAARVSKDHNLENHQQELQSAAIYAADRSVLKNIITAPFYPAFTNDSYPEHIVPAVHTPVEVSHITIQSADATDVADELLRNLDKLNTSRNNFEMVVIEYSETRPDETVSTQDRDIPEKAVQHTDPDKSLKDDHPKSKKERIIELAKAMQATDTHEEKAVKDSHTKQKKVRKDKDLEQPDELIEEIRVTKQEIHPESDKQKEQIKLINQFIKAQPFISSAKDRQFIPISDLNPIKSGEFGDNIVSETLVEILIKQGKKDKAIEVLKKLIWKYPQKKSYFASQIEDLKK